MEDLISDSALGLDQRQSKRGLAEEVPDFSGAEDFEAPAGTTPEVVTEAEVDDLPSSTKLFFVRVARPPINDDALKSLQVSFKEHVDKLKVMNGKVNAKRDELRELRKQMAVARDLRNGTRPDYDAKLGHLQTLRKDRDESQKKVAAIKEGLRGLDCKNEAELDAKVRELENRITHEGVALREEKQIVQQISRLQQQRNLVRDYDTQKGSLAELEDDVAKYRAIIKDLEGEFNIIRAEKDQASGIMTEIMTKLKAVEADLKELEEEQTDMVKAKNDVVAEMDKTRGDNNESMGDYRDNRSFSLRVRDLVSAGAVEEARVLCAAQVDEYITRLVSNASYRAEYCSLWAQQRRTPVSELLPESAVNAVPREAKPGAGGKGAAGKGGARPVPVKVVPAKPQGKEKAAALIEALMAEAQTEASRKPVRADPEEMDDLNDADDEEDALPAAAPAPVLPAGLTEAIKVPKSSASKPVEVVKVQVPVIPDVEFVPPMLKDTTADAPLDSAAERARLREEQARKAAEAEAKKRRLAEDKEKKKKVAEVRKRHEEDRKRQEALAALDGKVLAKAPEPEPLPSKSDVDTADEDAGKAKASKGTGLIPPGIKPSILPMLRSQQLAAAKRMKTNEPVVRKVRKYVREHGIYLAVIGVFLLLVGLVALLFDRKAK